MTIKAGTIARTITLALALVNQILESTGHGVIPITDEQVSGFITLAFTIGASLWTWWKNNSFTEAAIVADEVMHGIKEGYIEEILGTEEETE